MTSPEIEKLAEGFDNHNSAHAVTVLLLAEIAKDIKELLERTPAD